MSGELQMVDVNSDRAWVREVRRLFREYAAEIQVSLAFQDFDRELAELPGRYADGALIVATYGGGVAVGCVAVRPFSEGVAELKRMYVVPQYRGRGVATALLSLVTLSTMAGGHNRILLDTLDTMHEARRIYLRAGFREIPAYYDNPLPGARYYELTAKAMAARIFEEYPDSLGAGPFEVVLHNDDVTTQWFVMMTLLENADLLPPVAWALMMRVHERGEATIRRFAQEGAAEHLRQKISAQAREEGFPLKVTVERTPD
jgi:ATP-dependent Clp protease adapter protein ClpS/GNAT superfamily N-acetyltransferase